MSQKRKRALVICPGRGTYGKDHLASLKDSHDLKALDQWRQEDGYPSLSELDQAKNFKVSLHTRGEHASPLIFACALQDFKKINPDTVDIVAITGNSMGWYLALAMSQALELRDSYRLIQDMGALMSEQQVGGQVIFPITDENWKSSPTHLESVKTCLKEAQDLGHAAYISIQLGGYVVLAGDSGAVNFLMKNLPQQDPYPMKLVNHGAFHTPLMQNISEQATYKLSGLHWQRPRFPLIDGRGAIWQPFSTGLEDLKQYTLGYQITETYNYTRAIEVALKEFAPDLLILLGPGDNLGGATAQTLIANGWLNFKNKQSFVQRQKQSPFIISMARDSQAQIVT